MRPYFEADGVTLYHGDCRDVVPSLQPVDCIVADPPYSETRLGWDRRVDGWMELAAGALTDAGSMWMFGSLRSFLAVSNQIGAWQFAQEIVWEKHNGSSFVTDRFRRVHELLIHLYPATRRWSTIYHETQYTQDATARVVRKKAKPPHWHGTLGQSVYESVDGGPRMQRSVIYCRSEHGRAIHPTQKPLGILTPVIQYSCPPGGLVLDMFAGSGSTLVAARNTGRRAIGIEISERFCERAAKRLTSGQEVTSAAG